MFSFTWCGLTAPRMLYVALIPRIQDTDGSKKHLKKTDEKDLKIQHSREQFEVFREEIKR